MAKHFVQRWLARPEAAGLSRSDLEALRSFLGELDQVARGLGAATYEHVVRGDHGAVLLQMAGHARARRVATLLGYSQSAAATRFFLEAEGWDVSVVRRLGEVLAILAQHSSAHLLKGRVASPDFFRALVRLTARCAGQQSRLSPDTWLLDGPRCLELLALEGADQAALVEALFERDEGQRGSKGARALLEMRGLPEALAAAPGRALHGARALALEARCSFIELLGASGLCAQPAFLDFLFAVIARGGRLQTRAALSALTRGDRARVTEAARRRLASADTGERRAAARWLAHAGTVEARALLEQRLPEEKPGEVREEIAEGLRALQVSERVPPGAQEGEGYVSIHGDWVAIPPALPLPPDMPPPAGLAEELRAAVNEANRAARLRFEEQPRAPDGLPVGSPASYEELFSALAVGELIAVMSGARHPLDASMAVRDLAGPQRRRQVYHWAGIGLYRNRLEVILSGPGLTLHHLARIAALELCRDPRDPGLLSAPGLPAQLLRRKAHALGDLRPVLMACAPFGHGAKKMIGDLLAQRHPLSIDASTRAALWPVVAEHFALIDQALGLAACPAGITYSCERALELLALLPAPPRRYLHPLVERAVKGLPEEKARARALLTSMRGIDLILPFLDSGEQGRRIAAAQWLRERGDPAAITHLRAALSREKRGAVRAALLEALAAFGEDISAQLDTRSLTEEAQAALARIATQVGRCVQLEHLPALTWADGRPVAAEVVRGWVLLADKVQRPGGTPMLRLALERLEQRSAERLGILVLSSFVAYDTRRPSAEEASAYAEAHADRFLARQRQERPDFTREQALAHLRARKAREYLGSGIAHRGILALARRAPASEAVSIVKAYFRDHGRRITQCKALLEALAGHASPLALQLLLETSRGNRSASVRRHAARLVERIAEERGWTREELADRTVPTGGLDDRGVLTLRCGDSNYTAVLDAGMKVVLRNAQRKVVKALPSGEPAAAARKSLAELRRQLQQTVPQQIARLHDAMCAGRIWRARDAGPCLLDHPIVGRLCERLIFAGVNAQGQIVQAFRPLGDGSFSSVSDEPVDVAELAGIRVAHRVLMDEGEAARWRQHLEDYEVEPLFEQLERPVLRLDAGQAASTAILEREGYMIDALALRAAATRLGYERRRLADAAGLDSYQKLFTACGITAVIELSGGLIPEENEPCALRSLWFAAGDTGAAPAMALGTVPPVLLSEACHDLRTLAAAGSGFRTDWRARIRW